MTTQPTRCLFCQSEVHDGAALCPDCERKLEASDAAITAEHLDAIVGRDRRGSTRAQREGRA